MNKRLINREIAIKDRKEFFRASYDQLNEIIQTYPIWKRQDNFLEKLKEQFELFLDSLYKTRHFTFLSVGGDFGNIPDNIEYSDKLIVDLVDTIYSMAKYLYRFINHQIALRRFEAKIDKENYQHYRLIEQVIESDNNTILRELNSIQSRVNMFQKFIKLF